MIQALHNSPKFRLTTNQINPIVLMYTKYANQNLKKFRLLNFLIDYVFSCDSSSIGCNVSPSVSLSVALSLTTN